MYEKIVIVTRKTRLEELIERYNTREQARFYIEHMGLDFSDYGREHDKYVAVVHGVHRDMNRLSIKVQVIERGFLPNFIFTPQDLVLTIGPDGLVVNTAKYLQGQPIVAVNPDPERYDGILLPFSPKEVRVGVQGVLQGQASHHSITMAEAVLNDGQHLLAFNDFLIGQRSHVSARYRLNWRGRAERQSSSGVLVSTGAGSTGWLSSTQHMAGSIARLLLPTEPVELPTLRLDWGDPRLVFVVREPFQSRFTGVDLTAGLIEAGEELSLESQMAEGGVIFSDGVESDALTFNAGAVAKVRAAQQCTRLVANQSRKPSTRRRSACSV
jgi:NAD kinase